MKREPRLPQGTDLVEYLLSLDPELRPPALGLLGSEDTESLGGDWPGWAHEGQGPPSGEWRTWVLKAGRGFGKTLAGAKWVTSLIAAHGKIDIALVGATLEDARRVMVEGRSGLIQVADAWVTGWCPSLGRLTFRTGATATLFSGATPALLRGPEHHFAWCDELAKWEKPQETWDMLQLGLRLGDHPRALVTTTPRPGPVLTGIIAEPDTITTGGPSKANPHASRAWLKSVHALYAGTRLGRQELDGEILPEAGALWSVELLERCRIPLPLREGRGVGERSGASMASRSFGAAPPASSGLRGDPPLSTSMGVLVDPPLEGGEGIRFTKIAIGVDPPVRDGTCGIVACAKDGDGIAHVLADHSVTAASPETWSRAVADAARIWSAPFTLSVSKGPTTLSLSKGAEPATVVAEQNQGGRMVAAILRTADPGLRVKLVTATVGKAERAAPIAHLFEAGKILLHGRFPELEAELLGMVAGGDYQGPGTSPDRADAMVWALTELMLGVERAPPSIRRL